MPKTLLIADDSITIQKVVNLTFEGENVDIVAVSSGDVAIAKAKEIKPDIILADVFMPGQNGYEVCLAIKEDPDLCDVPVVLLVGTFEPFDEIEAARVKCNAYLTKPFDTSELLQIVRSLIGESSGEQNGDRKAVIAEPETLRSETRPGEPVHARPEASVVPAAGRLVSERTRESFLGSSRILDLFGPMVTPETAKPAPVAVLAELHVEEPATHASDVPENGSHKEKAGPPPEMTEEMLDAIVERIIRRMSNDVIREIAWEVVPELSEIIIRQYLEEKGKV